MSLTTKLLSALTLSTLAALALRSAVRSHRYLNPTGKTVLITGGTRGLGLALARQFAARGARLAICARNETELWQTRSEFAYLGPNFLAIPCDITNQAQVNAMLDRLLREFGSLDILINNAGTITVGPLAEMTLDDFHEALHTHLYGPLYTTLAALPHMKARRSGRIVNIASIGGKLAMPHLLPYSASKFALVGLSQGLRAELAQHNILVTTVCPALMRTGSPPHAFFKGQHRAEYTWFALADSLPAASLSARRAAHRILRATLHGSPEVFLSLPSRAAATFHGLFPGLTAELLALLNSFLPRPGGIGPSRLPGHQSQSPLTRTLLPKA